MTQARQRSEWNHTSALLAMIANVNRDPKKTPRPFQAEDFHPCPATRARAKPLEAVPVSVLRGLFCGG